MSTLATTNIKHPSSASNNIVLDSSGGVDLDALTVSGSAPADSVNIDASGRLLVGTSTARANFFNQASGFETGIQLEGTTYNNSALSITTNQNGVSGPFFVLGKTNGTAVGSNTVVTSGDTLGTISFQGADGSELVEGARIRVEVDGTPGANDMPGRLVFSTTADGASSPTERMRISENGTVRINNTSLSGRFAVQEGLSNQTVLYGYASNASYTDSVIQSQCATAAGTGFNLYVGFANVNTLVYRVLGNGNVQNTNGSYTTISDVKLKENIVDAGSQWDDFKAIQIRNWNFKAETGHETHRQIGPIAQELETVCPGLVFETPDRDAEGNETGEVTKGVNQSVLYMKAVKALQEAMERIERLETEMAAVKAQLS